MTRLVVCAIALLAIVSPAYAATVQSAGAFRISYASHVQRHGWQPSVADGELSGTVGQSLRVEAFRMSMTDASGNAVAGAIAYRAHVQDVGWQPWVSDGAVAGTQERGMRVEAVMIRLRGSFAERYDIYYRAHVQGYGWLAWAKNGAAAGSVGRALRVEALQVVLREKGGASPANAPAHVPSFVGVAGISISAHVGDVGWMSPVGDSAVAGTVGRALALEAFSASVENIPYEGGVSYSAHVQGIGWQGERTAGAVAGTTGRALRVEAVTFRLTGELSQHYDIYYRAHIQDYGWLGWTKDGARAGTSGMAKRVEALQVTLVAKGDVAPSESGYAGDVAFVSGASVSYAVGLSGGMQAAVSNGGMAGTTGQGRAIRALRVSVASGEGIDGGISYAVSTGGTAWASSASNGATASTGGELGAMRLSLTGTLSSLFDVYYRVHVGNFGWASWARNGQAAGSGDYGYKIEALEVRLIPKGSDAPGVTAYPYFDRGASHIGQLANEANVRQRRVVAAAHATPSPGAGLCAAWVEDVVANAGFGTYFGDARDLYAAYCTTSDLHALRVGMIVAVSRHPHTRLGSIYGHVAIYVGDGLVMDNVGSGYVRTVTLKEWMSWYGSLVPVRWGWLGNRALA